MALKIYQTSEWLEMVRKGMRVDNKALPIARLHERKGNM